MIPDNLQQAHDEYRAAIRRYHPERITVQEFIRFREAFLREFDRSEEYMARLQRLLDEKHRLLEQQRDIMEDQQDMIRRLMRSERRNS